MRIFITGGTGLIGFRLVPRLQERGDEILLLSRRPAAARERLGPKGRVIEGDPMQPGDWMDSVRACDAVIHLAGENIFSRRWNKEFKNLLFDSRIKSTDRR
jgi:NAD dependent epimerase/dehydratase family enzyme